MKIIFLLLYDAYDKQISYQTRHSRNNEINMSMEMWNCFNDNLYVLREPFLL